MMQRQDYSEKLNILVIEDNQGDFVLIEDYLLEKFKRIEIIHRSDFKHSINYLQNAREEVSLILLDLNLPDLEGIELIKGILACAHEVPIIVLTGYSDLEMAEKSLQIGISDYLVKDEINPVILYKTIIFALNRSSYINQIEVERHNYETLFNFNPQPTWLLDSNSLKILNANIAAQKEYGYSLDDFIKMSFEQLHPKEEKQLLSHKLTLNKDKFKRNYFTHFLSDGKEIKVDIYIRKIKSISGSRLIVQSNDVTNTLKHIDTIEIQNAKLRNIAWTQSHVVRAPLSRILGIINLIEMNKDNFDELQFCLKQLRVSSNEMDEIIKNIVDQTSLIDQT